jgi:hypothetical protein
MVDLGMTLGHRRKLQRAIAMLGPTGSGSSPSAMRPEPAQAGRMKRKYRRHSQQDPNAPIRPKTAYILFAEKVRSDPEFQGLAFADLAKETGRLWSKLSQAEKYEVWEKPADEALQRYKKDLKEYRETQEYKDHQDYLIRFYASCPSPSQQERSNKPQTPVAEEPSISRITTTSASQSRESATETEPTQLGEEEELFNAQSPNRSHANFETPKETNIDPMHAGMEEVGLYRSWREHEILSDEALSAREIHKRRSTSVSR